MSQACRLALVSKLLYDKELIEMRQENEKLKLEIFWRDYNMEKLEVLWNETIECKDDVDDVCTCGSYHIFNPHYPFFEKEKEAETAACNHRKWFKTLLEECGCVVLEQTEDCGYPKTFYTHSSSHLNCVLDMDAHFVGGSDFKFAYGARLYKATSVKDKELEKIKNVFDKLSRYHRGYMKTFRDLNRHLYNDDDLA